MGIAIPLHIKKPAGEYDSQHQSTQFRLFGKGLPLWMHTQRVTPMQKEQITITETEAQALGIKWMEQHEREQMSRIEIINREKQGIFENNIYTLTVHYICVEEIGYEEEILLK